MRDGFYSKISFRYPLAGKKTDIGHNRCSQYIHGIMYMLQQYQYCYSNCTRQGNQLIGAFGKAQEQQELRRCMA